MNSPVSVSIILPCFNGQDTIKEAVESVIAQSYKNWELIIVDDCSTDNSGKFLIENYSLHPQIRIFTFKTNKGVSNARNFAINQSKGDYLAFIDADDIWFHEKLEKQSIGFGKYHVICSDYILVKGEKKKIIKYNGKIDIRNMMKTNLIPNSSAVVQKACVGNIRFKNIGHEDYLFWITILKSNKKIDVLRVNSPLLIYRFGSGLSSNKFKAMQWQWNIYRSELKMPLLKTIYFFSIYALIATLKHFYSYEKN